MVVAGCVLIEAPVHQVIDLHLFGCELRQVDDVVVRYGVILPLVGAS